MAKRKVLVTDDTLEIVDFLTMVLEEKDYDVIVASDGDECLKKVLKEKPDLIIMDVMMPRKSGYHALNELRQKDPTVSHIPVIIMTGKRNVKDLFQDWQVDGFLHKPFDSAQLLETLENVWKVRLKSTAARMSALASPAPVPAPAQERLHVQDQARPAVPQAPAAPNPAQPLIAAMKEEAQKEEARLGSRILFVTRPDFKLEKLRPSFNALGFACSIAFTSESAVQFAQTHPVSLILLDAGVSRDVVNVLSVQQQLRDNVETQNIPAAFFSEKSAFQYVTAEDFPHIVFYEDIVELLYGIRKLLRDWDLIKLKAA